MLDTGRLHQDYTYLPNILSSHFSAGNGIGMEIVNALLSNPALALVIGVDINTDALERLLLSHQDRLVTIQGDVSDRSTSERAVQAAIDRTNRLDSVILNAAILKPIGPVADTSIDAWKKLFDVNFFGPLHSIQVALPYLRKSRGQILLTSTGVSLEPFPAWVAYATSKAAMNWLGTCLVKEEDEVNVLSITPGIVESGLQKEVREEHQANMPAEQYNWLVDMKAKGQLLHPKQPASTFAHLAINGVPADLNGQVVPWDDNRVRGGL
ncbi:NAD(P)-binding protein [Pyrenochaeta sp. DS3sAY3a]|nr:NAD(P)-binding protein [Pyrenochaeta sp. DS3sAY3a]